MRFTKVFVTGVLLAAVCGGANAQMATTPFLLPASAAGLSADAAPAPNRASADAALPDRPARAQRPIQPGVLGVFENFDFQLYVGYMFARFYEAPHMIQTRNGFDSSLSYYHNSGWIGVEGALFGGFGTQYNQTSKFVFAGGGPRIRWAGQRAVEFWGHGLVGGSHYVPQTAFGSQTAFGYEVGLGADATAHHRRLAYRLEVDMVGTHYFRTYQYSPKASVGIVWKF